MIFNQKPTVSVCCISKNEISSIRNMLENIKDIADEIVVVDELSIDGTREILKEYNTKIIDGKLDNNWGALRNKAIENATKDWILVIDADELLEPITHQAIYNRDILSKCNIEGIDSIVFSRRNYLDDEFQTSTYPDKTIRLFKNNGNIKYQGYIHEQIVGNIRRYESNFIIIHKKTWEKQMQQNERYIDVDMKRK